MIKLSQQDSEWISPKALYSQLHHYEFHGKPLNCPSSPRVILQSLELHTFSLYTHTHTHTHTSVGGKWLEHDVSMTKAVGLHRFTLIHVQAHKSHPYTHIKLTRLIMAVTFFKHCLLCSVHNSVCNLRFSALPVSITYLVSQLGLHVQKITPWFPRGFL